MKIYNRNGAQIADIQVDDDSFLTRSLMGEEYVELHFDLDTYVEFPVGCNITFEDNVYTMLCPAHIVKVNNKDIQYTLKMESYGARAASVIVRNNVDGRVSFDLTATPREHLQLIISNMNRHDTGWSIGECITEVESVVTYDYTDCLSALKAIADAFNTEYEIVGKAISIHKVEYNKQSPLDMSYGKGNGFCSGISRANEDGTPPPDFIYPQGSERNISLAQYGAARLHLPKNVVLGYDGEKYSDQAGYNSTNGKSYSTDSTGLFVAKDIDSRASYAEIGLDCTEIYPSRVGEVTDIFEVEQGDNVYYDIADVTIPDSLNYSADGVQIEGTTMTIVFQSGMLAGREIEVAGYNHSTRRFELAPMQIDGMTMPGGDYTPHVGDKYIVININLPQAYINSGVTHEGAEWQMFRKCIAYLHDHREQSYTFTGDVDPIWARANWSDIKEYMAVGEHIRFTDYQFQTPGIVLRVSEIKQYVNYKWKIEMTLTNMPKKSDFMTRFDSIRRDTSLIDIWDPRKLTRVNSNMTTIKRTIFGDGRLTQGTGDVVTRISTLETGSRNTNTRLTKVESNGTTNFSSLGTYGQESSQAFEYVKKIMMYNCEKIATGQYDGFEQAYEKDGNVVQVSDKDLVPTAPKIVTAK